MTLTPPEGYEPLSDAALEPIVARYSTKGWRTEFERKPGDKSLVQCAVDLGFMIDEALYWRVRALAAERPCSACGHPKVWHAPGDCWWEDEGKDGGIIAGCACGSFFE